MIKSLYVDHYRCLENFTVDFADRSSVLLLGRNGAGKSTVLNVLLLLQRMAFGEVDIGELFALTDFSFGETSRPITIRIEFTRQGVAFAYQIVVENRQGRLWVASEWARCDDNVVMNRTPEADASSTRLSPTVLLLPLISGMDDPLAQIRDWLKGIVIVAPQPSLMKSSARYSGARLLVDARNCLEWFAEIQDGNLGTIAKIISALQKTFSDEIKSISWSETGGVRHMKLFFKRATGDDLELDFDGLSDGEKCFVLAAFLSVKVAEDQDTVCFWDEPDNYLAVSEVARFITVLKKVFRRNSGCLIVTSHNVEGIQTFGVEETLVISRKAHSESATIAELAAIAPDGKNFLRKLLTGDLYDEQR